MEVPKMPEIPKIENIQETISNTVENAKSSINEGLDDFASRSAVATETTTDFLNSNSMIAKFAFLLLVVIIFVVFVNLGIRFITYLLSPSKNPYIINGLISGNSNMIIPQDPKNKDYVPIFRSNNATQGLECSWCFWIYISNVSTSSKTYSHVFNKGNSNFDNTTGIATINNAPGVYLKNMSNTSDNCTIRILMDTTSTNNNYIDVSNIPIMNWVNCVIRLQNTLLDVYINGSIAKRIQLTEAPKQNYDDINIGLNEGFPGQLSNLRYYGHALSVFEINNILLYGPNLTVSSKLQSSKYSSYLSTNWYSAHY